MRKEKIIYAALLAGTVVLVSFRGEAVAWLLFYFILVLPVLPLSYIFYIYLRLHIGQQVEGCVRKGERVPGRLKLENEDLLLMSGIVLNFYTDTCRIIQKSGDVETAIEQKTESFAILPRQRKEMELILTCKYRGTYPVGVKSVSVTDFFGLFTITYNMPEQSRVTVLPRILSLEQIQPQLEKRSLKKNRAAAVRLSEMPGFELRKYIPGDSLRRVHWKNSARMGELLVRKQLPQEHSGLVVIMDCSFFGNKTDLVRMQIEDNIIETAVALIFDAAVKRVGSRVVWSSDDLHEMRIEHRQGFDKFYQLCSRLSFCASMTLEEIWKTYERKISGNSVVILIGCEVSSGLSQMVDKSRRLGKNIVLIDTGEDPL